MRAWRTHQVAHIACAVHVNVHTALNTHARARVPVEFALADHQARAVVDATRICLNRGGGRIAPVSYTHLTLPTILLV